MIADDQPEDSGKTSKVEYPSSGEPVKSEKPPKQKGDWVTMPIPAAKPKTPDQPPASAPAPAVSPAQAPAAAGSSAPAPSSSASAGDSAAAGGSARFGSFLSGVGITDPNTQKWVVIGGGVLIVLCCGCSCLGVLLAVFSNNFK